MDNVSVSKGIFAYKGGYKIGQKKRKINNDCLINEPWYQSYTEAWSIIKNAAEAINITMFKQIMSDLESYMSHIKHSTGDNFLGEIHTAILLTGVNLPDHEVLFAKLAIHFSKITKQIAIIQSRDSGNMKNLTEETVFQLINCHIENEYPEIRKNQCTFRVLESWYREKLGTNAPLIIIIPDFESFNPVILRDFILVLSSYSKVMKFVLVFGVATTLHAVHRSLSYDVTSKLRVKVFHTQTQMKSLSDILEGTVLSGKTSFMLTGRAFQLLTDIFLFYDFSVHGFLRGYKLCMIQHFYGNNLTALCCHQDNMQQRMELLTTEDIKELRKLPSIVKYMEKLQKNKSTDMNSEEFTDVIMKLLREFHEAMSGFFTILKCLHSLTFTLPGAPLGKQLREIYASAVTCDIVETPEYKECLQLLGFLSKDELLTKLNEILIIIKKSNKNNLSDIEKQVEKYMEIIKNASLEVPQKVSEMVSMSDKLNRHQLKEKLLKMSQNQSRSPYKQAQIDLLEYLDRDIFAVHLVNPNRLPTSEIFSFSDANAAKHHLRGSLRAAIHTGINDPHVYLNCGCCKLENEETIQQTLPDISIIYKLHLESRKLINMYDWLQAFLTISNASHETDEREIDPKMQARFTRAVAELQFLGFIKSSRRKTDHVKRLT